MKEQLLTEIQQKMLPYLNNEQILILRTVLQEALANAEVSIANVPSQDRTPVDAFITAKRIEGCSEKTLKYYQNTIACFYGVNREILSGLFEGLQWRKQPERVAR